MNYDDREEQCDREMSFGEILAIIIIAIAIAMIRDDIRDRGKKCDITDKEQDND